MDVLKGVSGIDIRNCLDLISEYPISNHSIANNNGVVIFLHESEAIVLRSMLKDGFGVD